MDKALYEKGLSIRKEVLGEDYVNRNINNVTDFNSHFQEMVTEFAWGGIWGDTTLEKKTRSLINLAMLSALGRSHEFELHFRAALNNGCSADEIRATLEQVAIYCGMPAGVEAFRIGRRILDEQQDND